MKKLILYLFLGIFLIHATPVFAASGSSEVVYESVNPDSIFFPLKRQWEKFSLDWLNKSHESKQSFYKKLLDIRFKELVYVAENKKLTQFETAGSRYNTTVGYLIDNPGDKNDEFRKKLDSYYQVFDKLEATYDEFAYSSLLRQAKEITVQLKDSE